MSSSLRKISALFQKQIRSSYVNTNVLIMLLMSPAIALAYNMFILGNMDTAYTEDMQYATFALLVVCISLNIFMVGSLATTYMVSEEKEKHTLRLLIVSSVSPIEFLLGNGIATLMMVMISTILIVIIFNMTNFMLLILIASAVAVVAAITLGAVIGILSRDQMHSSVISLPFMSIFSLLPMFAGGSESLEFFMQILFTHQLSLMLYMIFTDDLGASLINSILIILGNAAVFYAIYRYLYLKSLTTE